MKKLFLQDGKLMAGEFPEQPETKGVTWNDYHKAAEEYDKLLSAAKASAVEVVNFKDSDIFFEEGKLYDIREGWTVEIEYDQCPKCGYTYHDAKLHGDHHLCGEPLPADIQLARLVPVKKSYPDQSKFATEEEYFEACRKTRESGIAATGVPDSGEKLTEEELIDKMLRSPIDPLLMNAGDLRVLVNGRPLPVDFRILSEDNYQLLMRQAVSPPPQAESQENWVDLWKEIYLDYQDSELEGYILFAERMDKKFTITRKP